MEVDESKAVEKGRVPPIAVLAKAEVLLVGRQRFGEVLQQEVQMSNFAVQLWVHLIPIINKRQVGITYSN